MEITQELVERIAHLARLALTEEEKAEMGSRLADILERVTVLDKLTLEDEPEGSAAVNVLRPDCVRDSTDRGALLENAPRTDGRYILLPDTVGGGSGNE